MKPSEINSRLANCNPYPGNVFKDLSDEEWDSVRDALIPTGITLDRVAGNIGRTTWQNSVIKLEELYNETNL